MLATPRGRSALAAALVVALPLHAATAQNFDYGSPAELQGVLWIYVETGDELEVRQNILKNVQKELPFLQVAPSLAEADVVLVFGANAYTRYYGTYNSSSSTGAANCSGSAYGAGNYAYGQANCYGNANTQSSSTPVYGNVVDGKGWIVIVPDQGKPRLVHEYADSRKSIFERRPSTNFARDFVKRYREANPTPPANRPPRSRLSPTQRGDSVSLTPEQALFAEKARGVLVGVADSLHLEPEWRGALVRRALPALENLFKTEPRASTAEIEDASRPATRDIIRMKRQYDMQLVPRAGEIRTYLVTKGADTTRFDAAYRDAATYYLADNMDLSEDGVSRFLALCREHLPQVLANGTN